MGRIATIAIDQEMPRGSKSSSVTCLSSGLQSIDHVPRSALMTFERMKKGGTIPAAFYSAFSVQHLPGFQFSYEWYGTTATKVTFTVYERPGTTAK
jgi:hypothetical protein